ncbi:hypothetical protein UCRNP2_7206 [Neofusicoccum parvum UCRNP2]|uniref:C2H2-type domain-containing protein n=2 Tax=Neofusicoccum parvum TaxID=310453 RepID=R1GCY7_BOTPV|nr:hypothetical protein UCRNP2_7206 [Neofusicoccum parvum UCRNP2]GME25535.1 hypothetical protein GTA08_BOTSDO03213 [Neofusicoccum parvum]
MTSRALLEAIDYASHERLKATIKAICEKSAMARDLVGHELMVDSRSSSEEPFHFPSVLPMAAVLPASGIAPSRKRPSIQFIECTRCSRKFETVQENVGECAWHDGTLAVDFHHEVWMDWCESTCGPLNCEENMRANLREFPEGFVWSCCAARGDALGCRRGPHQAREVSIKRAIDTILAALYWAAIV